jgi:D-serine deaminase-like pyridoxal phosphate-dependent protein
MRGADTNRLMLFHQPFLTQVAHHFPHADVLMGKPLPVQSANNFYRSLDGQSKFNASTQLQWLIDSLPRLKQYQALAESLKVPMQINIELDVGLHRGGVQEDQELATMLQLIETDSRLRFSGFMGYEPHIAKLPFDKIKLRDKAMAVYSGKIAVAEEVLGRSLEGLTLNAGGSPTYRLYNEGNFPHNELAAGSCLVKPTDFDSPELVDHRPAAFIATPVLKSLQTTQLPGIDGLGKLMSFWNPNRQQSFFTYGGYWKAKPESPAGLSVNPLYGRSTNQEMLNGSDNIQLQQDDWVFLRPTQSESVFLQFGDIAVYDRGEIVDRWPVLSANA